MIPSGISLYTWIDVEEVLFQAKEEAWPNWLVWVRAYWDSLTLGIHAGKEKEAINWLSEKFSPRFDSLSPAIILEDTPERKRTLEVLFEETDEEPINPRFIPSFTRPAILWPGREIEHPRSLSTKNPPLIAFHSFKGGVGRTVHALALALALVARKQRVLLIDADLEAPGFSWLLPTRLSNPPISFIDFLALVHGDPDQDASESIDLVANKLRDSYIDDIYVLPAFRSVSQFDSSEIRPEHLIQGSKDPFILTNILSKLGKALNVDAVIVDLRAGFSEVSAGLLLDPRIYRVIVTTLSSQSMDGTCHLLELLGKTAPVKWEDDPLPMHVISQVTQEYMKRNDLLDPYVQRLINASEQIWRTDNNLEEDLVYPQYITSFDQELLVLPDSWDDIAKRIKNTDIIEKMSNLADLMPRLSTDSDQGDRLSPKDLQTKRRALADYAHQLIHAESGEIGEFLSIRPLRNLASSFRGKVPIAVIAGAKGSGKTYTFLQIARRKNWQAFANDVGEKDTSIQAVICPIIKSISLKESAAEIVSDTRAKSSSSLGLDTPRDMLKILDDVRSSLRENLHEGEWRERWLDILAWGAGFEEKQTGAGQRLADYLKEKGLYLIFIIDGLEDLFNGLPSKENEQIALRSLLQDVPIWLEQKPGRPIGLLIFVRQDLINNAIKQNSSQLLKRYEPYVLKWNSEEALRLVAWITENAHKSKRSNLELQEMGRSDLVNLLVPLWGRKLGSENSREARSADWVITALSDLNGQIQARDVVRLLSVAARFSIGDTRWSDRLHVPAKIRDALRECSIEKIKDIGQENISLGKIFDDIRSLGKESRVTPFRREQLGLTPEDISILVLNGVIFHDQDEYYMPEIFRWGLDFGLKDSARPRVLTLARRAQKWNE